MYNSTIADTMSECNASKWDFILVSRVNSDKELNSRFRIKLYSRFKIKLNSRFVKTQKQNFRVVSLFSSRAKTQQRYPLV